MVSVMLYPCIFCIALLMDLFVLYVACLCTKQFAIFLGVVLILFLNVMDIPCMVFQIMCVLCL